MKTYPLKKAHLIPTAIIILLSLVILLVPLTASADAAQAGPTVQVDASNVQRTISPDIYGVNFADQELATSLNLPVNRWGGNATTRYNWLLDASNRGSDWYFESIPNENVDPAHFPDGTSSDLFVEQNRATRTSSLMTVPLIGWTPADREYRCGFSVNKYGAQDATDPWRNDCGNGEQGGIPIVGNDPSDTSMAIDPAFVQDWLRHLVGKYGDAQSGGVRYYALDNEPMLWHHTHRDVHPDPVTYDEIRDRSYQYGAAVRAVDPNAKILGPALWGWTAYFYSAADAASGNWSDPPDRNVHGGTAFVPWYLQQMRAYEQANGTRILDYLDLHYYPQAAGVALSGAGDAETRARRLRSTRSLWDPNYVDESWINEAVQLIPRMRQWVDENYPGTKLALSEYNWGALDSMNGALAQADVLGIFGREGLDLATLWAPPAVNDPGAFAFRMYRNYDGQGNTFGDRSLTASSSDQDALSVYAAARSSDGAITIMVINKSEAALSSRLSISGLADSSSGRVYRYSDADSLTIQDLGTQTVSGGAVDHVFPAESITLFVVDQDGPGATIAPAGDPVYLPFIQASAAAVIRTFLSWLALPLS